MCHENFVLDFGPRLNFIIGHNGSGKSAILTGISICLGAKASETNRGSNLKDLIKEGANTAHIQVVLSNEGSDAYDPGIYGSEIIIERILRRDATTSPYTLKSENGKKVSQKKADLDAILDYHNIAVNNPMAFLSQDAARSFLTASTDDQKYKFFMRGTLMDEIHKNLKQSQDQVQSMAVKIIRMKESLINLKDDAREAKKLHDRLLSSRGLRDRQRVLHGKYFWMMAKQAEEVVAEVRESQAEIESTIEQLDRYIKDYESKVQNADVSKEDLQFKKEQIMEKRQMIMTVLTEKRGIMDGVGRKIEKIQYQFSDNQKNIKLHDDAIAQLDRDIAIEEDKIKQKNGGSLEALQNQHDNLEAKLEQLKVEKKQVDDELSESTSGSNKEQYTELDHQIQEKKESIIRIKQHIGRLESSKVDEFDAYHFSIKAVVNDIKKARFQSPVIGPIGTLIQIKPGCEKWAQLVESHIASNLTTFLVENFNDHKQLQQILRRHNARSNIVIRKAEAFNYESGLPPQGYTTVLDLLHFKDERVKYALIDMVHVESVVVANSRQEAQQLLENRVRNVKMSLSITDRGSGQRSSINALGGFRVDPVYFDNNIPKLKPKDRSNEAGVFKRRYQDENAELNELETQKSNLKADLQNQQNYLRTKKRNLDNEMKKITSQKYQITTKLNDSAQNGRLEAFMDDKQHTIRERDLAKIAMNDLRAEIENLEAELRGKQEDYQQTKQETREITKEEHEIKEKIQGFESEKQLNITKIQHFEKSKQKRLQEAQDMTENLPAWEKSIEENELQAEESCTKEEADSIHLHDIEAVQYEIQKVADQVKRANEDLGKSPEEIINEDEAARRKFYEAKTQFDKAVKGRLLYEASLHDRLVAFRESRAATFFEADLDFKTSLAFRNFSGNLDFDYDKKKLTMYVSTKNDKKPRHVDSLSGGEKSFSQISLLLATWKPMRSRIKGLDEFDVFMDQVNRKIGMRLMLDKLSKENSQTIFITPQDIGQIAELDEKYVRIHRIKDPRASRS
ncbi:Structural maintenance of chromosomes protein [Wickerhamomyces ciferrii]|uniref:Structural maintenance of chromosomes protein n=1 Tax=Wickerhamomyces ciferrii (strain ATCC 14091 / BCRC 22168 / CBS 111 / JCM 3599 / NBRC 0793 / NRRL Y-1031 F-60-10) TaxID=1206466 RepID=K0KHX8_WICCF|nr:Structural maintenance of chromosomes protein [Wickerhamomyces ciferrii]CCH44800.1 Structural maintenance of chromosomes protein [Wickerhamomyces ciferrii]